MKTLLKILTPIILLFCISCDALKLEYKFDNSCSFPCWKGLTLGMSYEEVLDLINHSGHYSVTELKGPEGSLSIVLENKAGEFNVLFFSSEGILRSIDLSYKLWRMKLPLEKVINALGEPDHVIVWFAGRPMNDIKAVLCYPDTGITVRLNPIKTAYPPKELLYDINKNTNVLSILIDIIDPSLSGVGGNECKKPLDIALKHEWVGYGNYQSCNPDTNKFCAPYME
ncbi:MAG: hypothetical protein ACOYKD_05340 [Anaerolineaceae bacterium]|jgi:hypothetical protein